MKKCNMFLALLLFGGSAHAQLYKCTVDGKPLFSERPCAPNAKLIASGDGSISRDRQEQAAEVARREENMARSIDRDTRIENKDRNNTTSPTAARTLTRDNKKCENLLKTARAAKNEASMYRYHQGFIDDAKRRQKEAQDAHFSECEGSILVPYSPPPL